MTEAAQGRTPRGQDVVVIEVPNPAKLPAQAIANAGTTDGQLVWSLPTSTTWRTVLPRLTQADPAPIIRLTGDASTSDVAAAAREIKTSAPKARVEWVAPADALPAAVTDAATAAAAVDVIGLTIGPDEQWPTTMRRLDAWTTWAAQQRKRVAIIHEVNDHTLPGLVRSIQDWTAQQARHKRVAYTAADITGNTTSLAAKKARGQA